MYFFTVDRSVHKVVNSTNCNFLRSFVTDLARVPPFHTRLVYSETDRRWCHNSTNTFPFSPIHLCTRVLFAVDCSLHKAVNSTGIYCFASICRGRWFGTSLHVWSRTSVSPVFFPRSHKNCTNPACFRKIKTIFVFICPQAPKVTLPMYLQVKHN